MLDTDHTRDLAADIEDTCMVLTSLISNRYIGPFETEISNWASRLQIASEVLDQWLIVQALWTYLELVYTSSDIAKQLPQETKRFAQVLYHFPQQML